MEAYYPLGYDDEARARCEPHDFQPHEIITLYHVWDNLSQTRCTLGGMSCGAYGVGFYPPWFSITKRSIMDHLDPWNRNPTEFISFYGNMVHAVEDILRRQGEPFVAGQWRDLDSIQLAVVHLRESSPVWAFSRDDVLRMVGHDEEVAYALDEDEWFVWGHIPLTCISGFWSFDSSGGALYTSLRTFGAD